MDNGKWKGYNTDAPGFLLTLKSSLPKIGKALVLGTGGAAAAVAFALKNEGVTVKSVSTSGRGDFNYSELEEAGISGFDLIVNCTPLGTFPKTDQCPEIPYGQLIPEQILYDLVYNPSETLFLRRGKERGCETMNGMKMLVNQAELSWEIWFNAFIHKVKYNQPYV
jgi:shikimate dehydrogenase